MRKIVLFLFAATLWLPVISMAAEGNQAQSAQQATAADLI